MGSLGQLGWLEGIPFAKALRLEVVDKGAPGRPLRRLGYGVKTPGSVLSA